MLNDEIYDDLIDEPLDVAYNAPMGLFLVFAALALIHLVVSVILFISFAKKKKAVKLVFAIICAVLTVFDASICLLLVMGL